jgi:hypothetical protein
MPSEWTRTVVVAGALVAAVLAIVLVRSSAKSEKDQESADPQAEVVRAFTMCVWYVFIVMHVRCVFLVMHVCGF